MRMVRGAPGCASCAVKTRPATGCTAKTDDKDSVTSAPRTRSAPKESAIAPLTGLIAARAENVFDADCHSEKAPGDDWPVAVRDCASIHTSCSGAGASI